MNTGNNSNIGLIFCVSILALAGPVVGGTASFQGLGDLPGGSLPQRGT